MADRLLLENGTDAVQLEDASGVVVLETQAILVVANKAALTNGDTWVRDRLVGLGYTVTVASDEDAVPSLAQVAVVVLAESGAAATIGTKYRNVAVPVVVLDSGFLANMDMASAIGLTGSVSTSTITDATHPAAGGLSGVIPIGTSTIVRFGTTLAASARTYATSGTAGEAEGFSYVAGNTLLNAHTAEARRLFMGWFFDAVFGAYSAAANSAVLLDAGVQWAAGVAETHSGAGSLAATASLTPSALKAGKGTGSVTGTAVLAGVGGRIIGGAGSLALTATLTSAGRKAGTGAGALAPVASFASTAKRATSGTGALALTAAFARTAVKAGKGTASLSSPATLAGVGAAVPDYPTIGITGIGQGFNATNATSLSINPYNTTDPTLPESAFNDLVSVFVAFDGSVTDPTDASGRWFADSYPDGTSSLSLWVFTAREDNSTPLRLDLTWTGAEQVAWLAFAVGNTPENVESRAAQGLSAAPDPPLTPLVAGPLRNYLVVALAAWDNGQRTLTGNPAGYFESATQRTNTSTGVGIAAVWKAVQATQQDPTAYGISASDNWVALTYGYYRTVATADRTGTGALALTATFARTGVKAGKGTGALAASATFAATAKKAGKGTGSLALAATLVGVGRRVVVGTGSLVLSATLAATGRKAAASSGTLAASAVLVAVARKAGKGTGALVLAATLVATGSKRDAGSSSLGLTATLAASGRKAGRGTGTLALSASLVGIGRRVVTGTGSLALAASLAATGTKRGQGAGSVTASATFAATATKRTSGTGTLVLVPSFSTTGSAQGTGFGSGELDLTATLVATGRKAGRGAGTLALAPVLATVARTTRSGAGGTIFASAILVATGSVEDEGSSTLGLAASLTSSGTKSARTDANLDASAAAATTARKGARGAGSLALVAGLASTGIAVSAPKGAGSLALAPSLAATGRKSTSGSGALNLSATLDGRGRRTGIPELQPPGPIRVPEIRFPVGGERRGRGHLQLNARLSAAGERRFRAGRGYLRLLVRLEPGPGWAIEDANQAAALAALLLDDAA